MNRDPQPSNSCDAEPTIVSSVRAIRGAAPCSDDDANVAMLEAILQWLDERRVLDEEGVVVWTDESNGRVVAEGPRRLVRTRGHYAPTEVPTRREITVSALFRELQATPLGVVRQVRADLPHYVPRDVVEGLAALEQLLAGTAG